MLAAPDFSNYTAAEWDAERVWILSLYKQTEPLSWIYRGFLVTRSITSTRNVAGNTWNQQIHHMMVVGALTVRLWWSHALFRVLDASLSILSVFVKLSSACPLEEPLASCFSCWDVPYQCITNTGLCSSSSSTSSHRSRTASRGGSSMTQTRPAMPAKSWPSSSQRASSSRPSAFPSSLRELMWSNGGRAHSC